MRFTFSWLIDTAGQWCQSRRRFDTWTGAMKEAVEWARINELNDFTCAIRVDRV